jgi:glycosyltransferase involved in cell wall biosynthesis
MDDRDQRGLAAAGTALVSPLLETMKSHEIVHVCDFPNLGGGNFIPSQFELALLARQELGFATHFVFPEESRGANWIDLMRQKGVGVSLIDRSAPRHQRAWWIRKIVEEHRASLVHSHFTHFDTECAWAAFRSRARLVWHMHSGISKYTATHQARDVVKMRVIGRTCDRAIACAPWVAEQAVKRGFPRQKVQVVPNGIALDRFAEQVLPDKIGARRRFGIDPKVQMILAFCWSPETKGADIILDASRRLGIQTGNSVLVVMVGGEALESYLAERLCGERPAWLRVMAPVEDAPVLLRAADIFVSASRHEGMSYAVAEAMAAGLPVIVSDIPGNAPYFPAPGLTSFKTENSEALHAALVENLSRDDLDRLGRLNRDFAFGRFSTTRYALDVLTVYRELLDRPPTTEIPNQDRRLADRI